MENIGVEISRLVKLADSHEKNTTSQKSFARIATVKLKELGALMARRQYVFLPEREVFGVQRYIEHLESKTSYKRKFSTRGEILRSGV